MLREYSPPTTCHVSRVMCNVSHIMCHESYDKCHMSDKAVLLYIYAFFLLLFRQSWRVGYQRAYTV